MQCNSKGRQVCYVPVGRHGIRLSRAKEGESGILGYLACLQFVLHVYFGLDGANGFCEYNIKVEIIPGHARKLSVDGTRWKEGRVTAT